MFGHGNVCVCGCMTMVELCIFVHLCVKGQYIYRIVSQFVLQERSKELRMVAKFILESGGQWHCTYDKIPLPAIHWQILGGFD